MFLGRVAASCAATVAVAACAIVVVDMGRTSDKRAASKRSPSPTITARPAVKVGPGDPTSSNAVGSASSLASTTSASRPGSSVAARPTVTTTPASAPHTVAHTAMTRTQVVRHTAPRTVVHKASAKPRGRALPLHMSTGNATRVITVLGHSYGGTTARLQAWHKVSNGHWLPDGKSVTAHIGAAGMSRHASESKSATPIGSFTLTQAFGRNSNPGTRLPYIHTNRNDWWISQAGSLYNTHQRCSSGCRFTRGDPNEHLYYETPYYDYAVVIDYNTRNAPGGVRPGRGSAFFLHVTDGNPTAGCVAIPQPKLVAIMRWLIPSAHPRMLIGIS